ncbi:FecR family protein [Sphingobacterium faecale]|uniref:FecR domain-containing protein n=1 Tax=Sphingobacterium faecale TaxID=2803775 RepID=A0ABS1R4V2_9SPHI|nr:FecR family protein [Sphingobacterium faecale]MBL1409027.1 FecR domain-containing protein [Sphingobacterium faecale]
MDKKEINKLFERYSQGQCTDAERQLVDEWLTFGDFAEIQRTDRDIDGDLNRIKSTLPVYRPLSRVRLWKVAVAASLISICTFGLIRYYNTVPFVEQNTVQLDVFPKGDNPTLTLANGQKISLSKSQSAIIIKASELTYSDGSTLSDKPDKLLNISDNDLQSIETPYGSQYQVILDDGTKVWLNAGSILHFPQSFEGKKEREVTLSGEGYFEVAKKRKQPFIVRGRDQKIEVLGTHFNVSNYPESVKTKTTLIEGAVKVNVLRSKATRVLRPGEQAVLDGVDIVIRDVDAESASSWKDGMLDFRNEMLTDILSEIARTYNIEVDYEGRLPQERLYGKISKNKSLQSAVKILELSSDAKFKIVGRKLIVSSKK